MARKPSKATARQVFHLASDPLHDHRHELFAQLVGKGTKPGPAYLQAGYKGKDERCASNGASRLLRDEALLRRISYIRSKAAARTGISMETLVAEYDELIALAKVSGDYATVRGCIDSKAKVTGNMVADRQNKKPAIQEVSESELRRELERLNQTQERADTRLVH